MRPPQPAAGHIVRYVDRHMGDTHAAIVTQALSDGSARLTVFAPDTAPYPVQGVVPFDANKGHHTWHWPESTE
jgi:hypothetical protein